MRWLLLTLLLSTLVLLLNKTPDERREGRRKGRRRLSDWNQICVSLITDAFLFFSFLFKFIRLAKSQVERKETEIF